MKPWRARIGAAVVMGLVVSGCMAQAYAEELKREIPEIDAFIGLYELERVAAAVRGELADHIPDQHGAVRLYDHANPRMLSTNGYAYLKVAEGCGNPCACCPRVAVASGSHPKTWRLQGFGFLPEP